MLTNKKTSLLILFFISFLALSLPLVTKLVQQSQDDRSKAAESDTKVNLKIAFKGVKPDYPCLSSLNKIDLDIVNATTKAYQSETGISITPAIGETNKDGDQVFTVSSLSLNSNLKNVDNFNYFKIKSPAYLSARMCFNNQSEKVTNTVACDLSLTNNSYNFFNYPLNPGDLNQDGIVNASDFSMVKYNINPSADSSCGQQTDLNYDGITNSFDIAYLKQSLLQTNDEGIIDLNTITSTPTNTPTPMATPTPEFVISKLVFFGDSNMVRLSRFSGGYSSTLIVETVDHPTLDIVFVAEGATSIRNWPLDGSRIKTVYSNIGKNVNEKCGIILGLGLNDLSNFTSSSSEQAKESITKLSVSFKNYLVELADKYSGQCIVYFMSVNPVQPEKNAKIYTYGSPFALTGTKSNLKIETFNNNLKNLIDQSNINNLKYLDTYSYFSDSKDTIKNGFNTVDGIHYDKNTEILLLDKIIKLIGLS